MNEYSFFAYICAVIPSFSSYPVVKKFLYALGTCLFASPAGAQTPQDSIVNNFAALAQVPQEKLYLHTDKSLYSAGETLWFKGYLVHAMTHREEMPDRFILAELINRSDSVIARKKILRDTLGIFSNAFVLPPTLPAGDYYLRAYTDYMRNSGADFFFSRNLKIENPIDNAVGSTIVYNQTDSSRYAATVRFFDAQQKPVTRVELRYRYWVNDTLLDRGRRTTNSRGEITVPLPDLSTNARRRLDVEFDDPMYLYEHSFYPPVTGQQFSLTFFPEGGALMAVEKQRIAFKAQGEDGFSKAVRGWLFNARGDTLQSFRSEHDGMGVFTLLRPTAGENYVVEAVSDDQIRRRFPLPRVEEEGVSLSLVYSKRAIFYEVQQTARTPLQPLLLVAHTRGMLRVVHPIEADNRSGIVLPGQLEPGIAHFLLTDRRGNVLSERLLFIPDTAPVQWSLISDQPHYNRREKVTLRLAARTADGAPLQGNFSVSITNRGTVPLDTLADQLVSNLLLTSDLKGYIERPAYYFRRQDAKTLHHLDCVMMTHGWRRHRIRNVVEPIPYTLRYYMEEGQIISGKVKGLMGGEVREGEVTILEPRSKLFFSTTTDEHGAFIVSTLFKEHTKFLFQAHTKKGSSKVGIEFDKPQLEKPRHKGGFTGDEQPLPLHDYLENVRRQYYADGGEQGLNLQEVVISAQRNRMAARSIYDGGPNTPTIDSKEIARLGANSAYDALVRRFPGIGIKSTESVSGAIAKDVSPIEEAIYLRDNVEPAQLIVDDLLYGAADATQLLRTILAEDVEAIKILRGADALVLGSQGVRGGAVVVKMKSGKRFQEKPPKGFTEYTPPLGYSESIEFYHPTYDTPQAKENSLPDRRNTLYWNPSVRLNSRGEAILTYYTSDSESPADLVLEGITPEGKTCRTVHLIPAPANPSN